MWASGKVVKLWYREGEMAEPAPYQVLLDGALISPHSKTARQSRAPPKARTREARARNARASERALESPRYRRRETDATA